jgi:hypothetical protein
MPDQTSSSEQPESEGSGGFEDLDRTEPAWRRRRRLEAVFGDVMPESTSDDRDQPDARAGRVSGDAGSGDSGDPGDSETEGDRWLRAQVPPHHG